MNPRESIAVLGYIFSIIFEQSTTNKLLKTNKKRKK